MTTGKRRQSIIRWKNRRRIVANTESDLLRVIFAAKLYELHTSEQYIASDERQIERLEQLAARNSNNGASPLRDTVDTLRDDVLTLEVQNVRLRREVEAIDQELTIRALQQCYPVLGTA